MAEAALTSIAKSALQLFTSLAKDEFLLQWKSQKELEWLGDTIETVSCFLQDADKLQSKELSVQNCLARLRKVMYDADDFFDGLAWQALHEKTISGNAFKKEVHLWFSKLSKFKIAHEVKSIRESLDHIKADMVFHGFIRQSQPIGNQGVMRLDREKNKTHSLVHEEDVIGRDQERKDIVNLLLPQGDTSDGRSFSVVAVIGFGGLGKTTLAQLVYNDERVKQGFDVCLWACVNDLSNLEQVLIEIIASREGRLSDLGLEKLQEKLREIIGGRKFLVVLDDVWDEDPTHWLSLETILRCGKVGSKALVTTRSHKVAECLDASKPCRVDLGELSDESAWSLFVNKAFGQEGLNEHPELEPLGRKILSSCGNVPLAIVVVGSLIRQREKEEKVWSHFLENELGGFLAKSDDDGSQRSVVKDVLMVSYNDLLPHLKLCFAYCSLFPKDYWFDKDELVRLWLAQGFVKSSASNEQSLEEVGEDYFFHLVERCFFQEVSQYSNKITAKMHDLVHDVAIDVSKTDVILFDKDSINKRKMDSLRHISIDSEVVGSVDYCNLVSEPNIVRTLLYQHTYKTNFQNSQGSQDMLVKSFRLLRTLSLPNQAIVNVSSSIGELIHLRYLNLSHNTFLKHLPKSICRLHNLMTLELRYCRFLEKLPPKIEKLVSLRQLCIKGCETLDCLPPGLKTLTSLVNLDRLIVHCQSGGLGYLEGLDNLCGVLRIELPKEGWPCAVEDAKISNMSKKDKLSRMVIEWKRNGSYTEQEMGKDEETKVVEALEPHQTLEYLEISNYGGEKLPSWFCMLKNVKEIILYGCEHVEYIEDVMKDGLSFPSLETLQFCHMKNLKGWWRQEIPEEMQRRRLCLAKVSRVTIEYCMNLVGRMPLFEGVEFLKLEEVDVKLVAELLSSVNSSCSPHSSFIAPCGIINSANNKLKELELSLMFGVICWPEEWIRHLAALQRLKIHGWGAQRVSRRGLSHLTALKELVLKFDDCEIGDEEEDGDEKKDVDVGMPWKALRGLETLTLPVGDMHLHEGLTYLSCLKHLEIGKWKGVQLGDGETGGVQLPAKALQNLVTLKIGFEEGSSICHLPKAGIQHLHSLRSLGIRGCKELYLGWKTLLLKLEELSLSRVGSVIDVEDDWVGDQPTQLQTLKVKHCKDLEWAHYILWKSISSSLKVLDFDNIGERELPDGIQHLTSLQSLYIDGCEKLKSVPTWLPHLTSLQILIIPDCSAEMKRRCERERGADWPLIRYIPEIYVHARKLTEEEEEEARKIGWCGLTR